MGALTDATWGEGNGLGGLGRHLLAKRVSKSRDALLGVMTFLGHNHVGRLANATLDVLEDHALRSATFFVDTFPGPKPHPIDVVLMAALKCGLDAGDVHRIFGGVSLEADLTAPASGWLRKDDLSVTAEVPVRDSRADLIGHGHEFFERRIVIVELKNAPEECARLTDQLRDYRRAADVVRVVMTPECLARVTVGNDALGALADYPKAISNMGAELWLYDSTAEEFVQIADASTPLFAASYAERDYDELWSALNEEAAAA